MTKELSPEEQREQEREVALKNLAETSFMDLATAYLVDKDGQYGEAGNSAIEKFKYNYPFRIFSVDICLLF